MIKREIVIKRTELVFFKNKAISVHVGKLLYHFLASLCCLMKNYVDCLMKKLSKNGIISQTKI